ncbi:hypothetical protein CN918_25990 [Priestia megaterium]|nr:hypothetical protein CN918_25990 [Priestia megaterium]
MEFLKPLSPDKQKEALEQMAKGDEAAKDRLVQHNMRLVAHIAKKYRIPGMEPQDVISIGTLGLVKAVNNFKANKNASFTTYATKCIQNEIFMSLRKIQNKPQNKYLDEIVSYDANGHELSLSDTLGTEKTEIESNFEVKEDIHILRTLLERLAPKEKLVIEYRFGINREKKKQEDIAAEFDISQSYVSRIEKKAIKMMKEEFDKISC